MGSGASRMEVGCFPSQSKSKVRSNPEKEYKGKSENVLEVRLGDKMLVAVAGFDESGELHATNVRLVARTDPHMLGKIAFLREEGLLGNISDPVSDSSGDL